MWYAILSAVIVAVVGLDQATKALAASNLAEPATVIPHVLRFSYVENEGMAFGLLSEHRWIFLVLSTVGISLLAFYLYRYIPKKKWQNIGVALIVGGGIGNMIDRVALGYVVDFIDFCAFPDLWYWVFNVADAAVTVGGAIFIVTAVIDLIKEAKAEKAAKAEKSETNGET